MATTSRGKLAEAESVIGNLLAIVDHLQDIGETTLLEETIITDLTKARQKLTSEYAPEDQIDVRYHCPTKHALLVRTQMRELIQAKLRDGEDISEDKEILLAIERSLSRLRLLYFQVSPSDVTDPECPKCIEDYLQSRKHDKKKI